MRRLILRLIKLFGYTFRVKSDSSTEKSREGPPINEMR